MFTDSRTVQHTLNPGTTATMVDVNTNLPHGGDGGSSGGDIGISGMIALQLLCNNKCAS